MCSCPLAYLDTSIYRTKYILCEFLHCCGYWKIFVERLTPSRLASRSMLALASEENGYQLESPTFERKVCRGVTIKLGSTCGMEGKECLGESERPASLQMHKLTCFVQCVRWLASDAERHVQELRKSISHNRSVCEACFHYSACKLQPEKKLF